MNLETLFEKVINSPGSEFEEKFLETFSKSWIYFYFNSQGVESTPKHENTDVVLLSQGDEINNIPTIKNEKGVNGVAYTNLDLAFKLTEQDCTIGKATGFDVLGLFYQPENMSGLYIQTNHGNIHLDNDKLAQVLGVNS